LHFLATNFFAKRKRHKLLNGTDAAI